MSVRRIVGVAIAAAAATTAVLLRKFSDSQVESLKPTDAGHPRYWIKVMQRKTKTRRNKRTLRSIRHPQERRAI